jgi:ketosteroid isomerase-like protein
MSRDMQKDVHELAGIRERLQAAENAGRADDIGRMMAEDAVIMVPSQPVQEGRAACAGFIREVLDGLVERFDRRITLMSSTARGTSGVSFTRHHCGSKAYFSAVSE